MVSNITSDRFKIQTMQTKEKKAFLKKQLKKSNILPNF